MYVCILWNMYFLVCVFWCVYMCVVEYALVSVFIHVCHGICTCVLCVYLCMWGGQRMTLNSFPSLFSIFILLFILRWVSH